MKDASTGQHWLLFVAHVFGFDWQLLYNLRGDSPDIGGRSVELHSAFPLTPALPLPSDKEARKEREGGRLGRKREGMYGCGANTFICARVMGASAATVSRGNDLCRRLASKWATNELNSQ